MAWNDSHRTRENRTNQLASKLGSTDLQGRYRNLWTAAENALTSNAGAFLAPTIQFSGGWYINAKIGKATYKAFEYKAKLLILVLRALHSGLTGKVVANEKLKVDTQVTDQLGLGTIPELPAGGNAEHLAKWLQDIGIKQGDEKRTDSLSPILDQVNNKIDEVLTRNAGNWNKQLSKMVVDHKIDNLGDKLNAKIKNIHTELGRRIQDLEIRHDEYKTLANETAAQLKTVSSTLREHEDQIGNLNNLITKTQASFKERHEELNDKYRREVEKIEGLLTQDLNDLKASHTDLGGTVAKTVEQMHGHNSQIIELYARIFASNAAQRLQLQLAEDLYIANAYMANIGSAVGTGFDHYYESVQNDGDAGVAKGLCVGAIKAVAHQVPIVSQAVSLMEAGSEALSKLIGTGNSQFEAENDFISVAPSPQQPLNSAGKQTTITKLKKWAEGVKKNYEVNGSLITVGIKPLANVCRAGFANTFQTNLSQNTEKLLRDYKNAITALIDSHYAFDYLRAQHKTDAMITSAEASKIGRNFSDMLLDELVPTCSPQPGTQQQTAQYSTAWIGGITELCLYGCYRTKNYKDKPGGDSKKLFKRLGLKNQQQTPFNMFTERKATKNNSAEKNDLDTLNSCGWRKIPYPTEFNSSMDNRQALAHYVLVSIADQAIKKNWDIFEGISNGNGKDRLRKVVEDRIKSVLKVWFPDDKKDAKLDPSNTANKSRYEAALNTIAEL